MLLQTERLVIGTLGVEDLGVMATWYEGASRVYRTILDRWATTEN